MIDMFISVFNSIERESMHMTCLGNLSAQPGQQLNLDLWENFVTGKLSLRIIKDSFHI